MAGNGLLNMPMRQPMGPQNGGGMNNADMAEGESAPDTEGQGDQDQTNVSPEEQAQYDKFVTNGMKLIFSPNTAPKIVARLKADPNPVHGLAATTVLIVGTLKDSAARNGMELPPDILLHGGAELMSNIAELAAAAKVHSYTDTEIENASYIAMDMYGTKEMQKGTLDKQAIGKDFETMMAADKAGKIDEVLPGISQAAAQMKNRAPQAQPQGQPQDQQPQG